MSDSKEVDVMYVLGTAAMRIRNSEPLCEGKIQKQICHEMADEVELVREALAELIEASKGIRKDIMVNRHISHPSAKRARANRFHEALERIVGDV